MQADAEHQQNDANFGKLEDEVLICDEAGSVWAGNDTGQEVADEGGDFQTGGYRTEDEGQA